MHRYTVILTIAILLLVMAASAFAAGTKHVWRINGVVEDTATHTCTIAVIDELGNKSTIDGDANDLKGLMTYFGVDAPERLKGFRLEGNALEHDLNASVQWALHMSPEDVKIDLLSAGIISKHNFCLQTVIPKTWFVKNQYLRKDIAQKLAERIRVISNWRFELQSANAKDFNILPKAMCYDTFALVETMTVLVTPDGPESKSTRIHRFSLSADCTNPVLFDSDGPVKMTPEEMKGVHAP